LAEGFQRATIDRDYLLKVVKELISIPTVNPPGERYEEVSTYLRDSMRELGLRVEVVKVPDNIVEQYYSWARGYPRFIVIGRLGKGGPVLHFNGHYDVVPPGQGWSFDPFKPRLLEGRVYGRGASDMKGGIAAILAALKALAEYDALPGNGTVEAAFTPDEEVGGETGVKYMLDTGLAKPDYVVVAEPSTSEKIWIGNRGAVWGVVKIRGRQAHGSYPWLGLNAFEAMSEIAVWLKKNYVPSLSRKRTSLPLDDPRASSPTLTMGGEVRGGAKTNIVPGYYEFSIDRRVVPGERLTDVEEELKRAVEAAARETGLLSQGFQVAYETTGKAEAAWIPQNHPFVELAASAIRDTLGIEPKRTICVGGLDTRYYQERGIPAITYGPGAPGAAHMPDEYVPVAEMEKTARVYVALALRILERAGSGPAGLHEGSSVV